jgi:RNA polymerase sigma-B factor
VHYRSTGDPAAREAIVTRFLPLVRMLAGRYQHTSEPYDDLVQVGAIGLLKAIERFDVDRSTAFSSFAVPTISGEIKRHFRDRTWIVNVPRTAKELIQRMPRAERALEAKLGRSPTSQEMAEALGVGVEEVVDARVASQTRSPAPLDAPRDSEPGRPRGFDVVQEEAGFAAVEDAVTLDRMFEHLDDRDREILRLYVQEDLTQKAIAQRVGLSQMHVSRLMRAAITRLADIHEVQSGRGGQRAA